MINLQFLYLDENDSGSKVLFQDQNSQIVGIKFKKKDIGHFEKFPIVKNSCIYFLLSSEGIYIGKSMKGIDRVKNHVATKLFWDYGLMFVTDNKSWTSTTIDYLEYYFINTFKSLPDLSLENKDPRSFEPNITMFDEAHIFSAIDKIEFYLNCHNINTKKVLHKPQGEYFYNKDETATLMYDGEFFFLLTGSKLNYPTDACKNMQDNMALFNRLTQDIKNYLDVGVIDTKLILQEDIKFKKPSRAAALCVGGSRNGWEYFIGLNKLRGVD